MTEHAFPITDDAIASDAGIRWLRRNIAECDRRTRDKADREAERDYGIIGNYYRDRMIHALEHRITSFEPSYFDRRLTVP